MSGPSPTQRSLTRDDVAWYVRASLGPGRDVVDCGPLGGGGFATVWWLTLDDGGAAVLKVAPPPGARLLRYERGLAAAEARYFRLVAAHAPQVPVPRVLHHGRDPERGEWLLTDRLPGRPLAELTADVDAGPARADFGAATVALHRITGDRYGYDGDRSGGPTWSRAFAAIIDDLLADAVDWDVAPPGGPRLIRELVRHHAGALDEVRRPALLHFDGWDGNVLAAPDATGAYRMCGLVDGERYLWGDPLLDLVSPLLFRRAEDEPDHPFLRGWRAAGGHPAAFDPAARVRLGLYRLHLYLLMIVEMPSRGMTGENASGRSALLVELLDRELADLGRGLPRP
ncbi:aminoglycoside phosphotransferase family protein [Micromonospora haikouensis]|uniref:phosphotransferase family protein n=1 Tax=Micromonospora haikouensis TaxID=686309 RepID=UPI003448F4D4